MYPSQKNTGLASLQGATFDNDALCHGAVTPHIHVGTNDRGNFCVEPVGSYGLIWFTTDKMFLVKYAWLAQLRMKVTHAMGWRLNDTIVTWPRIGGGDENTVRII